MAFVGRQPELDRIRHALLGAIAGRARFVIISGEAGVGKTRLVGHVAAEAEGSGALVLTGWCTALADGGPPLAPVTAALRGLIQRLGRDALVPADLAALLPELEPAGARAPSQARLFYLVGVLLERLSATRPVVLVLEDLHWADRSTLGLLDVIARGLRDARVLVVVTYRSDDPGASRRLPLVLAELDRMPVVVRVELERFSRAETAEFIAELSGEPAPAALVDRIFDRSGGNPFFVEELVHVERAGARALGSSLRDLLLGRVHQLPELSQRAVRVVAAGGRVVPHPLLAATAGMREETLLKAVRGAVDNHVLVVEGQGYTFRHALTWEAVLGSLLPGDAIRLHRAYARALEEHPEFVTADRIAADLAYHWGRAAEPAKAKRAALRAASAAGALHAYDEQHHMLMRALELWPLAGDGSGDRVDILTEASRVAWLAGKQREALGLVDLALAEDRARDEPVRTALLLAQRARFLLTLGWDGALAAAEEAERLASAGAGIESGAGAGIEASDGAGSESGAESGAVRARVLDVLAAALIAEGCTERASEVSAEAMRIASRFGDGALRISVGITLGLTLSQLGRHDDALAELASARAFAESHRDELTRVHLSLAAELWTVGRYDEAIAVSAAGGEVAKESGLSRTLGAHIAAFGAMSLFATGSWDEADACLRDALELDPPGLFAILPHVVRGEIAAARGDLGAAKQHLAAARGATDEGRDIKDGGLPLAHLDAEIALMDGRLDDAWDAIAAALDLLPARGGTTYAWLALNTAARVQAHVRMGGQTGQSSAGEQIEALSRVAARLEQTTAPQRAHAAQLAAQLGGMDQAGAGPSWGDVVAAWDGVGDAFHACQARLRAAEAALSRAERPSARALLRDAAQRASAIGARPLRKEIEALARAINVSLTAESPAPVETGPLQRLGLTPREVEVLRLVTDGRSNRQIASTLVISVKTASVHVSRILTKLGVATRGEAAAAAYRLRLFEHEP